MMYKKRQVALFLFLLIILTSCNQKQSTQVWRERVCCQNENTNLKINKISINSFGFLEIRFCEKIDSLVRINLVVERNNKKEILFDLISKRSLNEQIFILDEGIKEYFGGSINTFSMEEGNYSLYIANKNTCGEIFFTLKNNKKEQEKWQCVIKCESPR